MGKKKERAAGEGYVSIPADGGGKALEAQKAELLDQIGALLAANMPKEQAAEKRIDYEDWEATWMPPEELVHPPRPDAEADPSDSPAEPDAAVPGAFVPCAAAAAEAAVSKAAEEETPAEEGDDIAGWRRKGRVVGKVASVLLTVQLVVLAAFALLCWGPVLLGWQTYGVVSDSMAPTMWRHDLAFVDRSVEPEDLDIGDVAAFHLGNGKVCGHRVIAIDPESRTIQTKGDSVGQADPAPVSFDQVFGETKGSIALIGGPLMFYQEHKTACVAVLAALAAVLFALTLVFPAAPKAARRDDKAKSAKRQKEGEGYGYDEYEAGATA